MTVAAWHAAAAALDLRLDPSGVVVIGLNTDAYGYDDAKSRNFYARLRRRLEQTPAVEAVGYGTLVPLTFNDSGGAATIHGGTSFVERRLAVHHAVIDAGYLEVLRIPLVAGRDFGEPDADAGSAIVNETFVRRAKDVTATRLAHTPVPEPHLNLLSFKVI